MHYPDMQIVALGDQIEAFPNILGEVVAIISDSAYLDGYPSSEWAHFESGLLVKMSNGALVRFADTQSTFKLISRMI